MELRCFWEKVWWVEFGRRAFGSWLGGHVTADYGRCVGSGVNMGYEGGAAASYGPIHTHDKTDPLTLINFP